MKAQLLFAAGVVLIVLSVAAAIAVAIILLIRRRHLQDRLERDYGPREY